MNTESQFPKTVAGVILTEQELRDYHLLNNSLNYYEKIVVKNLSMMFT